MGKCSYMIIKRLLMGFLLSFRSARDDFGSIKGKCQGTVNILFCGYVASSSYIYISLHIYIYIHSPYFDCCFKDWNLPLWVSSLWLNRLLFSSLLYIFHSFTLRWIFFFYEQYHSETSPADMPVCFQFTFIHTVFSWFHGALHSANIFYKGRISSGVKYM